MYTQIYLHVGQDGQRGICNVRTNDGANSPKDRWRSLFNTHGSKNMEVIDLSKGDGAVEIIDLSKDDKEDLQVEQAHHNPEPPQELPQEQESCAGRTRISRSLVVGPVTKRNKWGGKEVSIFEHNFHSKTGEVPAWASKILQQQAKRRKKGGE